MMTADTAETIERDFARRVFPTVSIKGQALTVLHMDASILAATTTLRLCPGRRVALRLDGATPRTATVDSSTVCALGKNGLTYAVCLLSEVLFSHGAAPTIAHAPATHNSRVAAVRG
jgi:hypothetical protein